MSTAPLTLVPMVRVLPKLVLRGVRPSGRAKLLLVTMQAALQPL